MSPIALVWLASLLGAVAFFTAGALFARSRRAPAQPAINVLGPRSQEEDPWESAPALAQIQKLRQENAELRLLAEQNAALQQRLDAAQVELSTHEEHSRLTTVPTISLPRAPTDGLTTAAALETLLARIAATEGIRAVVLADDIGLPVAGIGEYTNQLSAFAGFIRDVGNKTMNHLAMRELIRIELEDVAGTTLTACPLRTGDVELSLVTLSVGAKPSTQHMSRILESAGRMFQ